MNGPGKLCRALESIGALDGEPLDGRTLFDNAARDLRG